MQTRNWEDFAAFDADGQMITREGKLNLAAIDKSTVAISLSEISATPTPIPGTLVGGEAGDVIAVTLVAGQTYSFDMRGAAGGLQDPYLALFNPDFGLITEDDDGGAGTSSQITYKPTVSGTYYLYATSYTAATSPDTTSDVGAYTINTWSPEADVPGSTNVLASLATAVTIGTGTTFGNLDILRDNDYFAVQVKAGEIYTFNYSGGVSGAADRNGEFGENLATLTLYNSAGVSLGTNFNYESALSYFATSDTTIYLRVAGSTEPALGGTGGYTLDVGTIDPSTRDPLESLNWDSADNIDTVLVNGVPTAYVFFGAAGENFGETNPDGTPLVTSGWQPHQIAAVMNALGEYTPITGINYVITEDVTQAEFRMITVPTATYGARFYPQDPAYGTQQGIGTFNLNSGGFGTFPQSLEKGGYSYAVILHEFGHAHGIAHPHDTGGGSEVMLGVTGATGSLGVYNLNQGAYTVMSYNDAWQLNPDGPSAFTIAGIDNGWSATLGAFDIAVLQARYGVHAHNGGDTVYTLTDVADDANYQTIWDSGGIDAIAYGGTLNAQIDLTAATLDYTPTGGGVISFLRNASPTTTGVGGNNSFQVRGGFTIANGVVIENATSGSGNDVLIGNTARNVLTGNAGDDYLLGGQGGDTLNGGAGFDTASYRTSAQGVKVNLQGSADDGDAKGDRLISIEALEGSNFNDTLGGSNANDTLKGLGGNDLLESGNGDDQLEGGDGDDTLKSDNGNDKLFGGAGNDFLEAGNGDDTLDGGAGDDRLLGGNGNDTLNGGAGNDRLEGGSGSDIFVFGDIGGTDVILDFKRGSDKINLTLFDPDATAGDQAMTFVGNTAFTGAAGQVRTYNSGGTNYVAGDVNGDGIADFTINLGSSTVVATDFFL